MITISIASCFIFYFSSHYTNQYVLDSKVWFDADVTDNLEQYVKSNDYEGFNDFMIKKNYNLKAKNYFDMQYFNKNIR